MINWYLPLYLGVILILYLFPHIASVSSPKDYEEGRLGYGGLSTGTNLLLSRLISGDLLGFAILAVIHYGLLGGLGFASVILISLLIFMFIVSKLKISRKSTGILDLLPEQTGSFGYRYYVLILMGANLGNMVLQLAALQYLLGGYFVKSGLLIVFLVSILSLIYAGLGGWDALSKGAKPQIFLIFLATSLITISVFMEKGLTTAYLELVNIPPHPLHFPHSSLLFLTGVIVYSTQYLLDHSLWHAVYRLKPQKQTPILLLTVFCVLAVSLGFSAMAIYGLTQGLSNNLGMISILENAHASLLLNLYVITIFITVISSYAINLYSSAIIFLHTGNGSPVQSKENSVKNAYLFAFIIILMISLIFIVLPKLTLLQLFLFLSIFSTSLAPPFLHALFRPSHRERIADYAGLPPLLLGIGLFLWHSSYYIPLLCFSFSILLLIISKLLFKILKFFIKTS